jgi:hypothetical protein
MPECYTSQLASALVQALTDLTRSPEQLVTFCDTLLEHGGILPVSKKYVVPAAAVPVAVGKPLGQLLEALPSYEGLPWREKREAKRSRSRALNSHVGQIAAAAVSLLTRSSHAAAILPGSIRLSPKITEPPTFNSRTAYRSLLQQAADVTGAALPQNVRADHISDNPLCDTVQASILWLLCRHQQQRRGRGLSSGKCRLCTSPASCQTCRRPWCARRCWQPCCSSSPPSRPQ